MRAHKHAHTHPLTSREINTPALTCSPTLNLDSHSGYRSEVALAGRQQHPPGAEGAFNATYSAAVGTSYRYVRLAVTTSSRFSRVALAVSSAGDSEAAAPLQVASGQVTDRIVLPFGKTELRLEVTSEDGSQTAAHTIEVCTVY